MGGKRRSSRLAGSAQQRMVESTDVGDLSQTVYDEVDEFHAERQQKALGQTRIRTPGKSAANRSQEVLNVGGASSSDDDDEDDDVSEVEEEGEPDEVVADAAASSDSADDDDEQKYLPSASAWGKKRSAFYNTDYVGDDYGGLSGSDIETAELEEQEARKLQAQLQGDIQDDDYLGHMAEQLKAAKTKQTAAQSKKKAATTATSPATATTLVDQMSEQQRLQWARDNNAELAELIDESRSVAQQLALVQPLAEAATAIPDSELLQRARTIAFVMTNYLMLIDFYLYLKAATPLADWSQTRAHPVIDKIIKWKKLVNVSQRALLRCEPDVAELRSRALSSDGTTKLDLDIVRQLLGPSKSKGKTTAASDQASAKKKRSSKRKSDDLADLFNADNEGEEDDDDERRAIGKKIEKNRGLTPWKRNKKDKHSRVKRRHLYKKALIKKRSQIPDVKRELSRYGGEDRGIRASVVKSVKLK